MIFTAHKSTTVIEASISLCLPQANTSLFSFIAAPPGHVCYSNEHCRLWDKESHCEFVIPNLFGRCACNPFYKQTGDKCIAQKNPSYATEAVIVEQDAAVSPTKGTLLKLELPVKTTLPTKNSEPEEDLKKLDPLDTEVVKPSNLPVFSSSNDVLSTQEDSPLMQAVLKVPTAEPSKRLPVSTRKDGEPNELIRVDEMTANLHANDQPIYRVVTQPSAERKPNKKGSSKEQISSKSKGGHQKKSSLKGQ